MYQVKQSIIQLLKGTYTNYHDMVNYSGFYTRETLQ